MKKGRGGARKGAGRKAEHASGPLQRKQVMLDDETIRFYERAGDGELSAGIRKVAKLSTG